MDKCSKKQQILGFTQAEDKKGAGAAAEAAEWPDLEEEGGAEDKKPLLESVHVPVPEEGEQQPTANVAESSVGQEQASLNSPRKQEDSLIDIQ